MRNVPIFLMIVSLSGCATLGESDYACKGRPGKPLCRSTTEIYEKTHDKEALVKIEREEDEAASEPEPGRHSRQPPPAAVPRPEPTVQISDPMPIRTPAKVMRIWIAPWEDEAGDLIASGYVYTEIEPRRWKIGLEQGGSGSRVIEPLKAHSATPPLEKLSPTGSFSRSKGSGRGSPGNRPSYEPKPERR